ncbi:MAG: branched-chain amino acid ABC transporter permease [Oscillospiraceae bacterium]|nr:branched-chain amino acid ABC transporter permease [Oscillospiraceae bacterium]
MKKLMQNKTFRKNLSIYLLVTVGFVVMQILSSMGMLGSAVKGYLVPVCVYIVMAVSLNLLVGICGELSLGHAGFMGVGAFSGIITATLLQPVIPSPVLRLAVAIVVGGVLAGIFGVVIGIPALRLRGDYLAIVTLACGEILKNIFSNLYAGVDSEGFHMAFRVGAFTLKDGGKMIIDGPVGATGITKIATFPAGFVLILITLFVVLNLINSKEGRAIKAVRDNRIAAESVGINVTAFRMKAFVVSAFLAGMAGALFGLNFSSMNATKFNFNSSINILVFVVLGGMGNILGSVISATVLYVLPEALRGLDDLRMILYAIVLIVVMLCTWSPKMKMAIAALKMNIKTKLRRLLGKKEVASDE